MSRQLLLGILSSVISVAIAAADQPRNLVLHRAYDYWPIPSYGGPNECTDAEDKVQLTDGHAGGADWGSKPTVGWAAGVNIPVVIRFDLGEEVTLSELRFNTIGGGAAGVVDVGLRIYVSLDDKAYVIAGERPAPDSASADQGTRRSVQMVVPLGSAKARYVAVVAMPPAPYNFVFVDEIEIIGVIPADPKSVLPVQPGIMASGAKELQQTLAGGLRGADKLTNLTAPVERHITCWPKGQGDAQRKELETFRGRVLAEPLKFDTIKAELTASHRDRARQVYSAKTLVWEVVPDDAFTPLSLPEQIKPPQSASIHTVINALEATALGAANLTERELPLKMGITGGGKGAPKVSFRVARFFTTTHGKYVPDALLAGDCPQVIPPGESRLVWLEADSVGAKAGLYRYQVDVTLGKQTHRIPLEVRVHNVTLSRETPLATGNWADLNTGESTAYKNLGLVRDEMLANRITVGALTDYPFPPRDAQGKVIWPMKLDFTSLDKTLAFHKDFPKISFFIGFDVHSDRPQYDWFGPAAWMSEDFKKVFREWIGQIINRIKSSGRGYDQFYFMFFDETLDPRVGQVCELVHSVDPKVQMMITVPQADKESTKGLMDAGMNVFCYHAPRLEYDDAPQGMGMLSSGGRELWVYNAADIAFGVGKETDPLRWNRYLHWVAFRHGATGVHFWNMLWNNGRSPVWTEEGMGQQFYPMVYCLGPGYQDAPADVKTAETVIPSRRWRHVRMGIEDYMLLKMAQDGIRKLGTKGEAYQKQLDEIVRTVLTTGSKDRRLFRAKRLELIRLVEKTS